MSKKKKVLHVDNLIIHANNVEIIQENQDRNHQGEPQGEVQAEQVRRHPWDLFWGRDIRGAREESSDKIQNESSSSKKSASDRSSKQS